MVQIEEKLHRQSRAKKLIREKGHVSSDPFKELLTENTPMIGIYKGSLGR